MVAFEKQSAHDASGVENLCLSSFIGANLGLTSYKSEGENE